MAKIDNLVQEFLARTRRDPGEVILTQPHLHRTCTVRQLAINAVMAGCRTEYFPILLTAVEAIADPRYRLTQAVITSHPAGNAIIVSGPLAQEIGLASAGGCLGPGFRANLTIGRALTLSLLNVGRALPTQADLSTFGSPAELAFREESVKVTISLSKKSIEFFKAEAAKHHTQYQRMIRQLLDMYADAQSDQRTRFSTGRAKKQAAG